MSELSGISLLARYLSSEGPVPGAPSSSHSLHNPPFPTLHWSLSQLGTRTVHRAVAGYATSPWTVSRCASRAETGFRLPGPPELSQGSFPQHPKAPSRPFSEALTWRLQRCLATRPSLCWFAVCHTGSPLLVPVLQGPPHQNAALSLPLGWLSLVLFVAYMREQPGLVIALHAPTAWLTPKDSRPGSPPSLPRHPPGRCSPCPVPSEAPAPLQAQALASS